MGGGQTARSAPPCDLCALWREPTNPPSTHHSSCGTPHGLRIALVDDDAGMCLVARQIVQAQRDGWTLDICHPSCPVREPAGRKGSLRPNALEGSHGPAGPPDIVLIGLSGREGARLACVRELKALAPNLPVLIISGQLDSATIAEYCIAGADGWLTRPLSPAELSCAVRAAAQGGTVLCRQAEQALMEFLHQVGKSVSFQGLTQRQGEILIGLGENLTNKEIAQRLGVQTNTVHVLLGRLLRKWGVHTRTQLVKRLLRRRGVTHL